jgi:hypothetical protein
MCALNCGKKPAFQVKRRKLGCSEGNDRANPCHFYDCPDEEVMQNPVGWIPWHVETWVLRNGN